MIVAAAKYFKEYQTYPKSPSTIENSHQTQHLNREVAKRRAKLELSSDTNKLWLMYLDWLDTFTAGLHSLSLADWGADVDSIRDFAPFYVSSGRRNCRKSTVWYLEVIDSSDDDTLSLLTSSFVIRRNSK